MTRTKNIPKYKTNRAHERLMAHINRSAVLFGKRVKQRFGYELKLSDYRPPSRPLNIFS